jgi:hypothetical protein
MLLIAPGPARARSAAHWTLHGQRSGPVSSSALSDVQLFGQSLAVSGTTVIVGAPGELSGQNSAGAVFLFEGDSLLPQQTLVAPGVNAGPADRFGYSVASLLDGDQLRVLVGSPGDPATGAPGTAYLFDGATGELARTFVNPGNPAGTADQFGFAVALLRVAGSLYAVIGAPSDGSGLQGAGPGAVYVFDGADGHVVHTLTAPVGTAGAAFGAALAALDDDVLIGAPFDASAGNAGGAAYLFATASAALLRTFRDPSATDGDLFGVSVADVLDGLGHHLPLIGASGDDTAAENAGAAYLYPPSSNQPRRAFRDPVRARSDFFGTALAAAGDDIVVASPMSGGAPAHAGAAYVFDRDSGHLVQTLPYPIPLPGARFGTAVAARGQPSAHSDVFVSAPLDSRPGLDRGVVFQFVACGETCPQGCGNGVLEGREECDVPASASPPDIPPGCDSNCTLPACGNGVLDPPEEQCDDGPANGQPGDRCNYNCTLICKHDRDCADLGFGFVCQFSSCQCPICEVPNCLTDSDCQHQQFPPFVLGPCETARCVGADPSELMGGFCLPVGDDSLCDDGDPCTSDVCDAPTQEGGLTCRHVTVPGCSCTADAQCQDPLACNGLRSASCLKCDGCFLHDWSCCNRGSRCVSGAPPPDGTTCADANVCNGAESCLAGACVPGSALTCDDNNPCTADSCNPATGCAHRRIANGLPCGDGNACNGAGSCENGVCNFASPLDCDDHNPCTIDGCDPSTGCTHTDAIDGTSCDDGDLCNGTDTCEGGQCTSAGAPNCDDGDPCTADSCIPASGCVHTRESAPGCPACTTDGSCDDSNPCTSDACVSGLCEYTKLSATPCSDGNLCNGAEICDAGVCHRGDVLACDDGNPCTTDGCAALSGCTHAAVDDGTVCGLDDPCGGTGTCARGTCTGRVPLSCDDGNDCTADTCSPGSGCRNASLDDGTPCGTNDQCLLDAICQAGTCTGTRRDCSDGNQCTTDTCDSNLGCVHTALDCFDGVTCDLAPGLVDSSCTDVPLRRFTRAVENAHALIDEAHDAVLTSPHRCGRLLVAASKALGRARSLLQHSHTKSGCAATIKRLQTVQQRIAALHHQDSLARCASTPVSAKLGSGEREGGLSRMAADSESDPNSQR